MRFHPQHHWLKIVTIGLLTMMFSHAEPPRRGGRLDSGTVNQLVGALVDQVIMQTHPRGVERGSELARWRDELSRCELYRVELVMECLTRNASETLRLALLPKPPHQPAPPRSITGSCVANETFTIYAGNGQGIAFLPGSRTLCMRLDPGDTFVLTSLKKQPFNAIDGKYIDGYPVRITSGGCRGTVGYVSYFDAEADCK